MRPCIFYPVFPPLDKGTMTIITKECDGERDGGGDVGDIRSGYCGICGSNDSEGNDNVDNSNRNVIATIASVMMI